MRWIPLVAVLLVAAAPSTPDDGLSFAIPQELMPGITSEVPPVRSGNAARLLINGEASFVERLRMIDEAEESIYIQVLIFKADTVGNTIARRLLLKKAANPDMDIRIIVDAYSNIQDLDAQLMYFQLKDAGIAVEGYEAFYLHWLNELNLRDWTAGNKRYHEKYWIVDGRAAVVGGMNIGDEYARIGEDPVLIWRDQDVYLEGPVVEDVELAFLENFEHFKAIKETWPGAFNTDTYWQAWQGVHPDLRDLVTHSLDKRREDAMAELPAWDQLGLARRRVGKALHHDVDVRFVRSRPRLGETYIDQAYRQLIDSATTSVLIANAYFVPTEDLAHSLAAAAQRGVIVKVINNSLATNDIPVITTAGRLSYAPLMDAGVEIYEWHAERDGEGTMHGKFAVVDSRVSVIGSYNLDPRSLGLNSEDVVLIHDERLAKELEVHYLVEDLPMADRVTAAEAAEWSNPDLLPVVDEPPPLMSSPLFDAAQLELFLMRQVEKSL